MQSDSGIFYHDPARELWLPRPVAPQRSSLAVRFRTWICDGNGKILRKGNEGWNTITDYGMDAMVTNNLQNLLVNLHLSSALGPSKRVLSGGTTLSLTSIADPTTVPVTASAGFFLNTDVGATLYIDGLGQELKITAFTDSQHVTCATRQSIWLPGITPTTGPFSTAGVHFTNTSTLAADLGAFNTFDTTAPNYDNELNDSTNSRFINQRVFLTSASPAGWTINQLGWGTSTSGASVLGKVNLLTPDNVAAGQKYRVQLQFFSAYTPINISNQSVNWGATIGTYGLDIKQEVMPYDSNGTGNFLRPYTCYAPGVLWWTAAFSLVATKWQGDVGYSATPHASSAGSNTSSTPISDSTYGAGSHTRNRTFKISDVYALSAVTGIIACGNAFSEQVLTIAPHTGTITKPAGYYASLIFPLYWTRQLVN